MQHKQIVIAHAYYFLCEMLILFLVTLPILYHYFSWVPYVSYFIILVAISCIFSYIAYKHGSMLWCWLCLPILCFLFMMLEYPLIFTIIFPIAFVTDYVILHKQELLRREAIYIILGIVISAINFLIMNSWAFFSYFVLLILLVYMGYAVSHIAVTNKQARKQFPYQLFIYFIAILTSCAALFFMLADVIKNSVLFLWHVIVLGFTGGIKGLAAGVGYIFTGELKRGWPEQEDDGGNPAYSGEPTEKVSGQYIMDYVYPIIIIAVGCLLLVVIVLLTVMFFKKRKRKRLVNSDKLTPDVVYEMKYMDLSGEQKGIKNQFRMLKKPEHPIRKLVFQFERKAEKSKKGRHPFETVGEWLQRIGMDDELAIYQRVRYGDASGVTPEETDMLKSRLKQLQQELNS